MKKKCRNCIHIEKCNEFWDGDPFELWEDLAECCSRYDEVRHDYELGDPYAEVLFNF